MDGQAATDPLDVQQTLDEGSDLQQHQARHTPSPVPSESLSETPLSNAAGPGTAVSPDKETAETPTGTPNHGAGGKRVASTPETPTAPSNQEAGLSAPGVALSTVSTGQPVVVLSAVSIGPPAPLGRQASKIRRALSHVFARGGFFVNAD